MEYLRDNLVRREPVLPYMGLIRATAPAITLAFLTAGCASDAQPASSGATPTNAPATATTAPPVSATTEPETTGYFEGTLEEHVALMLGCLKDDGWDVTLESDGVTLGVDNTGRTDEELIEAQQACNEQIGQVQVQGLSETQLRERYEGRIEQFECLVENGLLEGEPKSFEVFVEDWERSGQERLWSPALDVPMELAQQGRLGPSQLCQVGGSGW